MQRNVATCYYVLGAPNMVLLCLGKALEGAGREAHTSSTVPHMKLAIFLNENKRGTP